MNIRSLVDCVRGCPPRVQSVSSSRSKTRAETAAAVNISFYAPERSVVARRRDEQRRRWRVVLCDEANEDDSRKTTSDKEEKEKEDLTIYNR